MVDVYDYDPITGEWGALMALDYEAALEMLAMLSATIEAFKPDAAKQRIYIRAIKGNPQGIDFTVGFCE